MYKIEPHGDQFKLLKNGVVRGLFNTEESAEDNKKFYEDMDKENEKKRRELDD